MPLITKFYTDIVKGGGDAGEKAATTLTSAFNTFVTGDKGSRTSGFKEWWEGIWASKDSTKIIEANMQKVSSIIKKSVDEIGKAYSPQATQAIQNYYDGILDSTGKIAKMPTGDELKNLGLQLNAKDLEQLQAQVDQTTKKIVKLGETNGKVANSKSFTKWSSVVSIGLVSIGAALTSMTKNMQSTYSSGAVALNGLAQAATTAGTALMILSKIPNISSPLMIGITAAVGAITGLIAVISKLNDEEGRYKENMTKMENYSSDLANKYADIESKLTAISEKETEIASLTQGTIEWKNAVHDLNEQYLALIKTYGLTDFTIDPVTGQIVLNYKEGENAEKIARSDAKLAYSEAITAGFAGAGNKVAFQWENSPEQGNMLLWFKNGGSHIERNDGFEKNVYGSSVKVMTEDKPIFYETDYSEIASNMVNPILISLVDSGLFDAGELGFLNNNRLNLTELFTKNAVDIFDEAYSMDDIYKILETVGLEEAYDDIDAQKFAAATIKTIQDFLNLYHQYDGFNAQKILSGDYSGFTVKSLKEKNDALKIAGLDRELDFTFGGLFNGYDIEEVEYNKAIQFADRLKAYGVTLADFEWDNAQPFAEFVDTILLIEDWSDEEALKAVGITSKLNTYTKSKITNSENGLNQEAITKAWDIRNKTDYGFNVDDLKVLDLLGIEYDYLQLGLNGVMYATEDQLELIKQQVESALSKEGGRLSEDGRRAQALVNEVMNLEGGVTQAWYNNLDEELKAFLGEGARILDSESATGTQIKEALTFINTQIENYSENLEGGLYDLARLIADLTSGTFVNLDNAKILFDNKAITESMYKDIMASGGMTSYNVGKMTDRVTALRDLGVKDDTIDQIYQTGWKNYANLLRALRAGISAEDWLNQDIHIQDYDSYTKLVEAGWKSDEALEALINNEANAINAVAAAVAGYDYDDWATYGEGLIDDSLYGLAAAYELKLEEIFKYATQWGVNTVTEETISQFKLFKDLGAPDTVATDLTAFLDLSQYTWYNPDQMLGDSYEKFGLNRDLYESKGQRPEEVAIDYGKRLARAQIAATKGWDADETYEAFEKYGIAIGASYMALNDELQKYFTDQYDNGVSIDKILSQIKKADYDAETLAKYQSIYDEIYEIKKGILTEAEIEQQAWLRVLNLENLQHLSAQELAEMYSKEVRNGSKMSEEDFQRSLSQKYDQIQRQKHDSN